MEIAFRTRAFASKNRGNSGQFRGVSNRGRWNRIARGYLRIVPLCNTHRWLRKLSAIPSFDASVVARRYKTLVLVMHGCIHLIQPAAAYFYSPIFEKTACGSISPRRDAR